MALPRPALAVVAILTAITSSSVARAQATGDWGGRRSWLRDRGVELGAGSTGEVFASPGLDRPVVIAGLAALAIDLALDRLLSPGLGAIHVVGFGLHVGRAAARLGRDPRRPAVGRSGAGDRAARRPADQLDVRDDRPAQPQRRRTGLPGRDARGEQPRRGRAGDRARRAVRRRARQHTRHSDRSRRPRAWLRRGPGGPIDLYADAGVRGPPGRLRPDDLAGLGASYSRTIDEVTDEVEHHCTIEATYQVGLFGWLLIR